MSFLFSGRVQLSKCAKNFTLPTIFAKQNPNSIEQVIINMIHN